MLGILLLDFFECVRSGLDGGGIKRTMSQDGEAIPKEITRSISFPALDLSVFTHQLKASRKKFQDLIALLSLQ